MHKVLERILNLLAYLLTAEGPVTADDIRHTVAGYDQETDEAFRRTFERDKDLLRNLGIPLTLAPTDAWEVEHGYVVPRDQYSLPDPGLTDEERAALWLAAQAVRVGGQPAGPDAIFKLGGAPMAAAGEPLAADLGSDADTVAMAFQAVTDHRLLGFDYHGRRRRLQPYGVAHQRGHWYVVGDEAGDIKAFRIDRASKLTVGDEADVFQRPAKFDVRGALPSQPWAAGEEQSVAVVHFDSEVAWWAGRQLGEDAVVDDNPDGSIEASVPVNNPDAFIGWVLGFEERAEIVGPPELRARLIEHVRAGA